MAENPGRRSVENDVWPELPLETWQETLDTLHMWLQIIGKIKLELVPFLNQWWNVTLLPTANGLTTGVIPYGDRLFAIEIDLLNHQLAIRENDGAVKSFELTEQPVAGFYEELMTTLDGLDIQVSINPIPVEVPHTIRFDADEAHRTYDPVSVTRWWSILLSTTKVLQRYCSHFTGKASPIHFFWGSFDLNQTRFSGRPADPPEGAPRFIQLAENEENVACGFWPGNTSMSGVTLGEPAFYSYIYPEPSGYADAIVRPDAAYHDGQLGQFILKYDDLRRHSNPEEALLDFFTSTYTAAVDAANWDRARLEIP